MQPPVPKPRTRFNCVTTAPVKPESSPQISPPQIEAPRAPEPPAKNADAPFPQPPENEAIDPPKATEEINGDIISATNFPPSPSMDLLLSNIPPPKPIYPSLLDMDNELLYDMPPLEPSEAPSVSPKSPDEPLKVLTTPTTAPIRPPPPRPPPPGWATGINPLQPPPPPAARPVPPVPTTSPVIFRDSSSNSPASSISPPSIVAPKLPDTVSPTRTPPAVPPRPLCLSSVVPTTSGDHHYSVVPCSTESSDPPSASARSTFIIENPGYMTLEKLRELLETTPEATPEPVEEEDHDHSISESASVSSKSSQSSPSVKSDIAPQPSAPPLYSNLLDTAEKPRLSLDVRVPSVRELEAELDLKTIPGRPTSQRKSFNAYTPPPRRGDFTNPFERLGLTASVIMDLNPQTSTERVVSDSDIQLPLEEVPSEPAAVDGEAVSFFGFVSIHAGRRDRKRCHARLRNMHLSFHDDDESSDTICGPYLLAGCPLICCNANVISVRLNEMESQKHLVFTVEDSPDTWALLLSECWLSQFDLLRSSVTRLSTCGSFYLRQGAASDWQTASGGIQGKTLYYVLLDSPDYIYELDIRKILNLKEKCEKELWCSQVKKKSHRGPLVMVLEGCSLYLECEDEWSTGKWYEMISDILQLPTNCLEDFRLTGDNVPIIVDKCIKFISGYGMSSEGIYRRNGKISEAKEILQKLTKDPANVHLTPATDETVYAVADVLRQFFRKLSSPLIPISIHQQLFQTISASNESQCCSEIHRLLSQMTTVHYSTLRKLMAHLREVSSHSDKNRASIENLAKVFGPSLFHTESEETACFKDNSSQISVIVLLIAAFNKVFDITTREEISRTLIEQAQQKTASTKKVRAEGLLVPVHLWELDNRPFNVKTDLAAEEACREAVAKRGFDREVNGKYCIYEIIRGGSLSRRLPMAERLSEAVINRWIPWKCLDGYLLFSEDTVQDENDVCAFSGKIKMAEPGSKTFRSFEMKIEQGQKIVAMKGEKRHKEWQIDDVLWYFGCEAPRKAPYSYNATFFVIKSTNFSEKFVGFCVSFKVLEERNRFMNQISYLQTGGNPVPLVHI